MVKIVVIEDEADIANRVGTWLEAEGYQVTSAINGRLGLEAIYQEIPDLIVCDIAMPEMSGHEVLIEVRSTRNLNHIPFVFLTASGDRDDVRKGMNLGADDYLSKPVTQLEVVNAIRSRLYKQATQDRQTQNLTNLLNTAFTEEREKRLLKSRMIALFSHDFRNPLAAVLASSNIIRNYGGQLSPERKVLHLDRIDGSVHLLIQMLDDMMAVAELEDGQFQYVPHLIDFSLFVDVITEEFRLIDQDDHILTVHSALEGLVEADPKLLRQILSNLISNALKYSPVHSEVSLTLSHDDNRINLRVHNWGVGIAEKSLPHVFDPFYRAENVATVKGTGLGLSIVKQCVECHNGRVSVVSPAGEGTTFVVDLPLIRE